MLDLELEHAGGIPAIQALLLLGDLECSVGRDNVGWMYAGMAMRLCYDIGLQLDTRQAGMSEREIDIRRMTLWACVIFDRYWSLFLGRPLTMKSVDLEIYTLADQFERLGSSLPAGPSRSTNTRIYEALIDLMEVAGRMVEYPEFRKTNAFETAPDQAAYFRMAALDKELHDWAARLPMDLRYTEENRKSAPFSFYLLHQQFHAALILLHRPFARYDEAAETETEEVSSLHHHFSLASRGICTKSAITIARIFWQHRQKFDGKYIFSIGMQHAGVAAMALVAALAYIPDAAARNDNMQYLEVLHAALEDMSHLNQPAERMVSVLNAVMTELRGGPIVSHHAGLQSRRASISLEAEQSTSKRRHTDSVSTEMAPPASTSRQNRGSTSSRNFSVLPQQQVTPAEMMIPSEPNEALSWANAQPNVHYQHMQPGPEPASMKQPEDRVEWKAPHMIHDNYSHMQPLPMQPNLLNTDAANLGFMFPTQDEWNVWNAASYAVPNGMLVPTFTSMPHSTTSNDPSNQDESAPQGRFVQNHNFPPSGTGGNIRG